MNSLKHLPVMAVLKKASFISSLKADELSPGARHS